MIKKLLVLMIILFWVSPSVAEEIKAVQQPLPDQFFEQPNPLASEWHQPTELAVKLLPQNVTTPSIVEASVAEIKVKALHNGTWLAVRMEWLDPVKNLHVVTDQASDAAAIQLPIKDFERTLPFMGNKDYPVEIIQWKAIWQNDVEKGYQKVKDIYPNTWVDTYQFGKEIAMEVKNPLSDMARKNPVEELIAVGFGTLTHQSVQDSYARGAWENGKWTVVITHKLKTQDPNDPVLTPGQETRIAFALWDGEAKNVGARKNYAPWVPLLLEKK